MGGGPHTPERDNHGRTVVSGWSPRNSWRIRDYRVYHVQFGPFDWTQLEIPLETCKLGSFNYSWSTVVISLLYTLSLSAFLYKDLYILGNFKVQAVQLQSTQYYPVHRGTYIAHSKHPTM